MPTYHIKFKNSPTEPTVDERIAITAFSWVATKADQSDWPLRYDWRSNKWEAKGKDLICTKCGGFIYKRARLASDHILGLIRAFGAPLTLKHIYSEDTCQKREHV